MSDHKLVQAGQQQDRPSPLKVPESEPDEVDARAWRMLNDRMREARNQARRLPGVRDRTP
jgi:hypothetical protein